MSWKPGFEKQDVKILTTDELDVTGSGWLLIVKNKLQFKLFQGGWSNTVTRHRLKRAHNAAAILLYNPYKNTVLLIEQIRIGALERQDSPWMLEIVAGVIEQGSDARSTAVREAKEEAGCTVLEILPICNYLVSSGISTEQAAVFIGKVHDNNHGALCGLADEGEDIKVHEFAVAEAIELLAMGKIFSASSIIALQYLQLNLDNIRAKWSTKG